MAVQPKLNTGTRSVEGCLLMVEYAQDGSGGSLRVYPPGGPPVSGRFGPELTDRVGTMLRRHVRVVMRAASAADRRAPDEHVVEALLPAEEECWGFGGFAFEETPSLEDLARAQGVSLDQGVATRLGAGRDLWASDEEFDAFLETLAAIRKER